MKFVIYVPAEIDGIYNIIKNILSDCKIHAYRISVEDWKKTYKDGRKTDYLVYKYECRCWFWRFIMLRLKWKITKLKSEMFIEKDRPCYTFEIESTSE